MLAAVQSAVLIGVDGLPVTVEVHVGNGLPGFTVVGHPDGVCREARDRVRAAVLSTGLEWPQRRVTVNLAPSDRLKTGAGLDLAMCLALLAASKQLPAAALDGLGALGELGLDGSIRAVRGMVPLAAATTCRSLVVPAGQYAQAQLVGRRQVRPATHLRELVAALKGAEAWPPPPRAPDPTPAPPPPDLADVRGQPMARWAVEVAAAGGHHLMMTGPPGAGKSMLATRLVGLLPPLGRRQALEVTRIHSAAGLLGDGAGLVEAPPFMSPHHRASAVSLLGGGSATLRPGVLSLAHHGVLFLDELGEFPPFVLDSLRQPLEDGLVRIHRAQAAAVFPARFLLVAASNPCPCGGGDRDDECVCPAHARLRYLRRLNGPLMDRFDLRVRVRRPDVGQLLGGVEGEPTSVVALRVMAARQRAEERGQVMNAALPAGRLDVLAPLTLGARRLAEKRLRGGQLTARGLHRVRRVALTLADLAGVEPPLTEQQLSEAMALRETARRAEELVG